MADTKLTALSDLASPAGTDLLYVVATPGATPTDKKATIANVVAAADPKTHTHSYAATDIPFVTTAASAGLSAEVAIPGLAGSADITGAAGAGTSEEYDTATTGLTWADSDPDTVDSNTTVKSHLYVKSVDGTQRSGLKAWAPAGAFDVRAKVSIGTDQVAQNVSFGLIIENSDRSLRAQCTLHVVPGSQQVQVRSYTYASSTGTQRGSSWIIGRNDAYVRITRDGSNNLSFWWSVDGLRWILIVTYAFTLTVAKVGIHIQSSNGLNTYGLCDWIRTDV